jgi:DNA invertase Pin-like site-specific DNA recombinase
MAKSRGKPHEQRTGPLRCAIYTRKSTEEGLDQEFNSLDAQREACAAFIVSQKHEGWRLVPSHYDDGGFSGGTMERPGLKRLLADVRAGKVDIIVVYKVDRLTRALSDFAKIVDILDATGASFVSITQAFNTTTSMGRLTLNVLLSFAQFEREVISERVRDKVAASKAKGMWMGGRVPLGYRVEERKLLIDAAEADTVRHIFQRYLELGTAPALLADLRASNIRTKPQTLRDGSPRGGIPFTRGSLYHLLKNRIYRGEIVHKGKAHAGEHEAIVPEGLFNAVQERLAANIGSRRSGEPFMSPSLLTGMIRDGTGRPMSPSHTVKAGKRYRYYVSNQPGAEQASDAMRLPAKPLDGAVLEALGHALQDTSTLMSGAPAISAAELSHLRREQVKFVDQLTTSRTSVLRLLLANLDLSITVHADRIEASCCKQRLLNLLGTGQNWDATTIRIALRVPFTLQRRGHERKLKLQLDRAGDRRDPKLIALIIRAHAAREQLARLDSSATVSSRRELARVARASYLAPDIIAAIFEGMQPSSLQARRIERGELPIDWDDQRAVLGFR